MNLSNTVSISLDGLSLANAVTFDFGDAVHAPMQRAVVLEDVDAFAVRYADATDSGVTVLGSWSGALNNSGEEIEVVGAGGKIVFSVEYQASDPWDFIADGNGGTLSLIDPVGTPIEELSKYYRWFSEAVYGALIVFDATDFGGDANVPGQIGFDLSASEGEEVFLTQSIGGVVTRIEDAVEFGANVNGVSLGRMM